MLTDTALKNLKPKEKAYKVADRDGMYVHVTTSGSVTFRYDYRLNGRRETLTIGKPPLTLSKFSRTRFSSPGSSLLEV